MDLLILYGVLAIAISFLCSLLEACLLSLPRSTVATLEDRGTWAGGALREMKENIDRPLAAILTLNTVAHTVGAAGVGGQAAVVFGSAAVGVASAVMTVLILVVSEIIPKTLGAVYAKSLATAAAVIIRGMILLCLPLIIPLEWINRLIGYQRSGDRLSRSELLATIRRGQASGAMRDREYQIASNLVALSRVRLADILTPRTVIFSLPEEMTVEQALARHHPLRFARIPVYTDAPNHVSGYVARFAIHAAHSAGEAHKRLKELAEPIPVLPEVGTVDDALDRFIQRRYHIALVVDEYGGVSGIVTLEDLLETLLGAEITDEADPAEDMREWARLRRARRG